MRFKNWLFGFSLVELMISLIVISVVTAAFAPVLTKQLKTSDQSIGTATTTSLTSSAICNSVSKGCIECEDDKCIAAGDGYYVDPGTQKSVKCPDACKTCNDATSCKTGSCADGYYADGSPLGCAPCSSECGTCLGSATNCLTCANNQYYKSGSSCLLCSTGVGLSNCKTCSSSSVCTSCNDNYFANTSGKCESCSYHCTQCSSASVCTKCADSYIKASNGKCFKYTCDSLLCYLTINESDTLSLYKYTLGEGSFQITADMGIYTCTAGEACSYTQTNPVCWLPNSSYGYYLSNPIAAMNAAEPLPTQLLSKTACTGYAVHKAEAVLAKTGWRAPKPADGKYLDYLFYYHGLNSSLPSPLCVYTSKSGARMSCRGNDNCRNNGRGGFCRMDFAFGEWQSGYTSYIVCHEYGAATYFGFAGNDWAAPVFFVKN